MFQDLAAVTSGFRIRKAPFGKVGGMYSPPSAQYNSRVDSQVQRRSTISSLRDRVITASSPDLRVCPPLPVSASLPQAPKFVCYSITTLAPHRMLTTTRTHVSC